MAQIPDLTVPEVQPRAQPAPELRPSVPAGAFGAEVAGASLEGLGKSLGEAGSTAYDYATKLQTLHNDVAATTNAFDAASKVGQFYENWKNTHTQNEAVQDFPNLQSQIQKFIQDGANGLSATAQVTYNETAQRYAKSYLLEASGYVAAQGHDALTKGYDSGATSAGQIYASSPSDETRDAFLSQAGKSALGWFQSAGINDPNDPQVHQKLISYTSKPFEAVISSKLANGDVAGATAEFARDRSMMDDDAIRSVSLGLKSATGSNFIQSSADAIINGGKAAAPGIGVGTSGDIKAAILGQESSTNPAIRNSSAGAVGIGQIEPKTFAQFARPGEDIHNAADNQAVSGRILDKYMADYGNDPARAAVAYFSGPGNVAPAGAATPWKRDAADSDGTHTSTYVHQVLARMGGSAEPAGETPTFAPIPKPNPSTNVDQWYADATQTVVNNSKLVPGTTAQQQWQIQERALAQLKIQHDIIGEQQKATFDSLSGELTNGKVASVEQLKQQNPVAYGNLPPQYQHSLDVISGETDPYGKVARYQDERGKLLSGEGLADDVRAMNVNPTQMGDLIATQDRMKRGQLTEADRYTQAAMKDPMFSNFVAQYRKDHPNLNQPGVDAQGPFNQINGALATEVDNWLAAHPGTTPTSNDYHVMISAVAAKTGTHYGFEPIAAARATVPDDFRSQMYNNAAAKGLPRPSEADIEQMYGFATKNAGTSFGAFAGGLAR